jgi:hypothetical protein
MLIVVPSMEIVGLGKRLSWAHLVETSADLLHRWAEKLCVFGHFRHALRILDEVGRNSNIEWRDLSTYALSKLGRQEAATGYCDEGVQPHLSPSDDSAVPSWQAITYHALEDSFDFHKEIDSLRSWGLDSDCYEHIVSPQCGRSLPESISSLLLDFSANGKVSGSKSLHPVGIVHVKSLLCAAQAISHKLGVNDLFENRFAYMLANMYRHSGQVENAARCLHQLPKEDWRYSYYLAKVLSKRDESHEKVLRLMVDALDRAEISFKPKVIFSSASVSI